MSYRFDSAPLIAGAYMWGNRGLGVLAEDIPSTGESGPSYLFNDLTLPADNGKEIRGEIIALPSAGTFTADEYGRFEHTGAPDGDYTTQYRLYVDGADQGTAFIYTSFGGGTALDVLSGSFTTTGFDVTLVVNRKLNVLSGPFTTEGQAITITPGVAATYTLDVLSGTYTTTGNDIEMVYHEDEIIMSTPIIVLLGSATLQVPFGGTYADAGAVAIDPKDGDLTSSITVTGSVDTNTVGEYVLQYDVINSMLIPAATVTRTVTVLSTTATLVGDYGMTFLQAVQQAWLKCGLAGSGPTTVTNLTGMNKRIRDFVEDAYLFIQKRHERWEFLWNRASSTILAGQNTYAPSALNVSDLNQLARVLIEVNGQIRPLTIDRDYVGCVYDNASAGTTPTRVTRLPNGTIVFNVEPTADIPVHIEYHKKPAGIINNTDTFVIPAHHQDLIITKAVEYYSRYDEDNSLLAESTMEFAKNYAALCRECLPEIRFNQSEFFS